jgi:hypothetical protein
VSVDSTSLDGFKSSDQKESNEFVLAIEEPIFSVEKCLLEFFARQEFVLIKLGLVIEPFVFVRGALLKLDCNKSRFPCSCMDKVGMSLSPHALSMSCTTFQFSAICTLQQ